MLFPRSAVDSLSSRSGEHGSLLEQEISRSALIEDEPFGASMEVDEEYQERSTHILSAVSSSTSMFDVEMSDSNSKRKFDDTIGDDSSVELVVPIPKRRAVEDAMDTDDEHSVVCVSGKNDVVDASYDIWNDFVGSEVEGGAEIQPRQKSITRRGSRYQLKQHLDSVSSDDDDDCDDDDDSSRCSVLTDDSNKHTGDDRCNPYFEGLDVAAVNCVGQRLNRLELCDDEPNGVSRRSHVSDVSDHVDRYVRRSIRIIPFSRAAYMTRSVAASLVKRTRSGRRY